MLLQKSQPKTSSFNFKIYNNKTIVKNHTCSLCAHAVNYGQFLQCISLETTIFFVHISFNTINFIVHFTQIVSSAVAAAVVGVLSEIYCKRFTYGTFKIDPNGEVNIPMETQFCR